MTKASAIILIIALMILTFIVGAEVGVEVEHSNSDVLKVKECNVDITFQDYIDWVKESK